MAQLTLDLPASASELQDCMFLPKSLYLILAREVTVDTRILAQVKQRPHHTMPPKGLFFQTVI